VSPFVVCCMLKGIARNHSHMHPPCRVAQFCLIPPPCFCAAARVICCCSGYAGVAQNATTGIMIHNDIVKSAVMAMCRTALSRTVIP